MRLGSRQMAMINKFEHESGLKAKSVYVAPKYGGTLEVTVEDGSKYTVVDTETGLWFELDDPAAVAKKIPMERLIR